MTDHDGEEEVDISDVIWEMVQSMDDETYWDTVAYIKSGRVGEEAHDE